MTRSMTNQTITAAELEKFTVLNRREILFYLRQLINDGERISVVFNEGQDAILTVLLDIDETDDLLIFDWGSNEADNRKLLRSERNFFVCAPHGIGNRFTSGAPHQIFHNGRPAYAIPLPTRYVRLQRREFFRLVLPLTRRALCTLRGENGAALQLSVIDISIGGIGMEVALGRLAPDIGQVLKNARIELKGIGTLDVDLEVRNTGKIQRGSKVSARIGCRFVELSRAMEHQLQRFITDVQREDRARLGS